jgi:hypothetical protein
MKRFLAYCATIHKITDVQGRKVLTDNRKFICNHWDAIVLRLSGSVCGSCTEPLVSHILSGRLSRNPLAWSEHGVRQMAMLRVYVKNGGVVKAGDIRVSRGRDDMKNDRSSLRHGYAKYRAYSDKQVDGLLNAKLDWSAFQPSPFSYGKLDGSKVLLKAWAQARNSLVAS